MQKIKHKFNQISNKSPKINSKILFLKVFKSVKVSFKNGIKNVKNKLNLFMMSNMLFIIKKIKES